MYFAAEFSWVFFPERDRGAPGQIKVIDLDLSKYDRIASRFRQEQS